MVNLEYFKANTLMFAKEVIYVIAFINVGFKESF